MFLFVFITRKIKKRSQFECFFLFSKLFYEFVYFTRTTW